MKEILKWEYTFYEEWHGAERIGNHGAYKYEYDRLEDRLKRLGDQGWEVISVIDRHDRLLFTLKRPAIV